MAYKSPSVQSGSSSSSREEKDYETIPGYRVKSKGPSLQDQDAGGGETEDGHAKPYRRMASNESKEQEEEEHVSLKLLQQEEEEEKRQDQLAEDILPR